MNTQDQYRLAIQARCNLVTVRKWLRGDMVSPPLTYALEQAAKELGLGVAPTPPDDVGT